MRGGFLFPHASQSDSVLLVLLAFYFVCFPFASYDAAPFLPARCLMHIFLTCLCFDTDTCGTHTGFLFIIVHCQPCLFHFVPIHAVESRQE